MSEIKLSTYKERLSVLLTDMGRLMVEMEDDDGRTASPVLTPAEWDAFVASGNAALGRPAPASTPSIHVETTVDGNTFKIRVSGVAAPASPPLADVFDALATEREAEAKACWSTDGDSYRGEAEAYRKAARMVREQGATPLADRIEEAAKEVQRTADDESYDNTSRLMDSGEARGLRAALAMVRDSVSTPLLDRLITAACEAQAEANIPNVNDLYAAQMESHAEGLQEAIRMVREAGPMVPRADVEALRAALTEALDGWEYCTQYKLDYLVEKHGDKEDIAKLRALHAPKEPSHADD